MAVRDREPARAHAPAHAQALGDDDAARDAHDLSVTTRPSFWPSSAARSARPEFRYEVSEHVAYCFSCIGRALEPEEAAAVLLVEVFELAAGEAAKALDLSESTFRHRLASGRRAMTAGFDDLCALVNKRGACHQCATLRDASPADRRGVEPPRLGDVADDAGRRRPPPHAQARRGPRRERRRWPDRAAARADARVHREECLGDRSAYALGLRRLDRLAKRSPYGTDALASSR